MHAYHAVCSDNGCGRCYWRRNVIKRFLCRLKQVRRIATRYGKLALCLSSVGALAATVVWLN